MDLARIRQGIADAVKAVGLDAQGLKLTCTPYVPDSVTVPAFYVSGVDEITYATTFGAPGAGLADLTLQCTVLVSRASDRDGQAALDAYLSTSTGQSIYAAIEAARGAPGAPALAGACDDLHVTGASGYGQYTVGDGVYYGARFQVHVIGSGA